ncbi:unnamed protein product [Prorocentrum cordatum]|uniref:Fibronectin type-III domain-containing protein n=1 Tax=Prorocentrum cordatum TaxID=2364126 RepID=A0ABN9SIM6_9DINO|nr:unnamed protein product [Polarella glacialis]
MEPVVCVSRALRAITLEVMPAFLPSKWQVESLLRGSWLGGAWAPVEVDCAHVEGPAPGGPALVHVTILGLQPDTDYEFRFVHAGGGGSELLRYACRTAGRPAILEAPCCSDPKPDAITVEWRVPEPEGKDAGVLECQLQCRPDVWFSRWEEVVPKRMGDWRSGQRWAASVGGLSPDTEYMFRVRARNCAGWSSDFSAVGVGRTSERPPPPVALRQVSRLPGRAVLAFDVIDPPGAPVEDVQAEVHTGLKWRAVDQSSVQLPPVRADSLRGAPVGSRTGRVTVGELPPGVDSVVRLWAKSAAGVSAAPSEPVHCTPSCRPPPPEAMRCTARRKNSLEVEWRTRDAEGAPVTDCIVEHCKAGDVFAVWHEVPKADVRRVSGKPNSASWSARLEGLDAETRYLVRVAAGNKVGWSEDVHRPVECQTAVRPPAPCAIRCASYALTEVTLEFDVPMERAQAAGVEAVSAIRVERSGMLQWIPAPEATVAFAAPSAEAWWPSSQEGHGGPGVARCCATVSELTPGTWYTFRVWVGNEIGWSRDIPPTVECHTALLPEAPVRLQARACGLHSLQTQWHAVGTQGAPLIDCEVQLREDSVLTSWDWQPARGGETLRRRGGRSSTRWGQLCDGLRPATAYVLRVRASNAVGWSGWSAEATARTPSAPCITVCTARPTDREVEVEVRVPDPEGAPVRACLVSCAVSGRKALGLRAGKGSWSARLPALADTGSQLRGLSACAMNAAGCSLKAEPGPVPVFTGLEAGGPAEQSSAVRCCVAALLEDELARQRAAHSDLEALVQAADAADDAPRGEALRRRLAVLEAAARTARQLRGRIEPAQPEEGQGFGSWADRCRAVLKAGGTADPGAWAAADELSQAERLLEGFELLAEGGVWLEQLGRHLLEPLWGRICGHAEASPKSARVFQMWARQRQDWSQRFDRQLLNLWQDALQTALQLLSAVASGGDARAAAENLRRDASALLSMREACDEQLRKLRSAVERLEQVTADGSAAQSFDEVTVLDKISQTALSVLLSAVMPVPGSLELGVVSIGALWLEDDAAGRHVAVEHSKDSGAEGPLQRFGQRPGARAAALLQEWAAGGHGDSVLVHNATARRVTVKLLDREEGMAARTYSKMQRAHPMVRVVSKAISGFVGDEATAAALLLEVAPADVEALRLPSGPGGGGAPAGDGAGAGRPGGCEVGAAAGGEASPQAFDLEFAYGAAGQTESAVGRFPVHAGSAISFVCLNREVLINNVDAATGADAPQGPVALANHGAEAVTFRFFAGGGQHLRRLFEKPLLVATLAAGEQRTVAVPAAAGAAGAGAEGAAAGAEDPRADGLLDVEVLSASGKTLCNARRGQTITYEGSL